MCFLIAAIESIRKHRAAYLIAVGGAAYLVAKAIRKSRVVGFADLGMEAIYEFDVVDMPVTVAVDAGGTSAHITGPAEWQKRIATGEFTANMKGRDMMVDRYADLLHLQR